MFSLKHINLSAPTLTPTLRYKESRTPPFKPVFRLYLIHLFTIQGVEIYYHHQVIGTRPKPKKAKWAQVKVIDLMKEEEYSFETEHVVLNVPATVRRAAEHSRNIVGRVRVSPGGD